MNIILQRARESGKCPPSLLSEERSILEDAFDAGLLPVLDAKDFFMNPEPETPDAFFQVLEKAKDVSSIPAPSDELKKATLEQRRCILLAVVGGTPNNSPSLTRVLDKGFLVLVKTWLEDILSGSVGGVDLLLHLLSNVADLPVTKSVVKDSGMGKLIGSIEKHSICKGTPNETAIKERVERVKSSWNASVKARKAQDATSSQPAKRPAEIAAASPAPAKKPKTSDEPKKTSSSFSSLLKKVSRPASEASLKTKELLKAMTSGNQAGQASPPEGKKDHKKNGMRVKWVDHFGGQLEASRVLEGDEDASEAKQADAVSWSDRKKRDRLREKELLSQVKKSKLLDDEESFDMPKQMQPTAGWRTPYALPDRPDVTKAQLDSSEVRLQEDRMKTLPRAQYSSDYDVPDSPAPLSDVEQALDMTSQSSTIATDIPFFVPEPAVPEPVPAPAPGPVAPYVDPNQVAQSALLHSLTTGQSTAATPEFVQALGLPLFLVGQDVQALQTLASSPSLLSTLVDAHGMYDQTRLLSLVQTLSSSSPRPPPPPPAFQPSNDPYRMPSATSPYGQPPPYQAPPARNGFRSNNPEGNLHISGYGMGTTEADIIALFSPYVRVDEVVLKGTFAFVNTSDPVNANIAREALSGTLVGGMPVRINAAQRKSRDGPPPGLGSNPSSSFPRPSFGQGNLPGQAPMQALNMPGRMPGPPGAPPGAPPGLGGQPNVDSVRDDRGNPATKNLFVAGYGPGTTEGELRDLFGQHVNVIGVVSKGTFSFVNTESRESAVLAREALGGLTINGGVLRINFAKETGRLGTSFDLTYGKNTGPNAAVRPTAPTQNMSYYGRGGY